jgi:hypothetical protein
MKSITKMSSGALFALVVAMALVSSNAALASSELKVIVEADVNSLDVVPTTAGGPFYIGGVLKDPDTGEQIGIFHCWGYFFQEGLGVVNQEYDFTGRGKIILTGVEDEGPRAITGGTGDFRNARGQATGIDLSNFPVFPVNFDLVGAGARTGRRR